MRARRLVLGLLVVSCGSTSEPITARHASLGGETAARVGDVVIPASLVGKVAAVQQVKPGEALDRLIDDALAAQGARASGADHAPGVQWTIETILGRAISDRVGREARAAGPPTDDELAQVTRIHWLDVDLPEQARVVHAVVRTPKDPSQNDAARALAARIAAAVSDARDDTDFIARATAVPHGAFEVVVQPLPPFVADGRFAETPPSVIDPGFAKAAFALKPGETSGVIPSPFGWHVIRVLERLPPKTVSADERRARFTDEVIVHRAHVALASIFKTRRQSTRVGILPDADARMTAATPAEVP